MESEIFFRQAELKHEESLGEQGREWKKCFRKKYREAHPWWWTRAFRFVKRLFWGG